MVCVWVSSLSSIQLSTVDQLAIHALSRLRGQGCVCVCSRYVTVNKIVSLASINIPSHQECPVIPRKQPGETSHVPWRNGLILVWDATSVDIYVPPMPSHYLKVVQVQRQT